MNEHDGYLAFSSLIKVSFLVGFGFGIFFYPFVAFGLIRNGNYIGAGLGIIFSPLLNAIAVSVYAMIGFPFYKFFARRIGWRGLIIGKWT